MRALLPLALVLALAACGSDGAPEPVGTGLTITGSSTIGIKKGS